MNTKSVEVRKVDLRPLALLEQAKNLIGDQYWTMVGICAVGAFVMQLVPIVLYGPAYIGIYLCFKKIQAGGRASFDDLFKGFESFAEGLLAYLGVFVAAMAVFAVPYAVFLVAFIGMAESDNQEALPLIICPFYLLIFPIATFFSVFALLPFSLIADHGTKPMDALKLSFRAIKENLWSIFKLGFVYVVGTIIGSLLCLVGVFFVWPFLFGMTWLAHKQLFTDADEPAYAGGGPAPKDVDLSDWGE